MARACPGRSSEGARQEDVAACTMQAGWWFISIDACFICYIRLDKMTRVWFYPFAAIRAQHRIQGSCPIETVALTSWADLRCPMDAVPALLCGIATVQPEPVSLVRSFAVADDPRFPRPFGLIHVEHRLALLASNTRGRGAIYARPATPRMLPSPRHTDGASRSAIRHLRK